MNGIVRASALAMRTQIRSLFRASVRRKTHRRACTPKMRTSVRFTEIVPPACTFVLLVAVSALSQSLPPYDQASAEGLVRAVVANELRNQGANDSHWMYHVDREEQGKATAKEVIQTAHGTIDKLASVDAHPLSATQELQESNRIRSLTNNSAEQQRIEQLRKKDAEQCKELFKMIPDAFLFTYAGSGNNVVKLNYVPNPGFQPPSREARVFHELQGQMWVDATQRRLIRMSGELMSDVKFAGGLLGYLQKGGHFDVQRQQISPGEWELTSLDVQMQGKALLMKTISIQQKERRTNFRPVPGTLTISEAAEMLGKRVVVAANQLNSAGSE